MTQMISSRAFTPTRGAGLARLAAFAPFAGRAYAARRNADLGPDDRGNVSVLSPYLRHRLVTEREVLDAVLRRHAPDTCEKFVQEVFWRAYFKGHLETRPEIWRRYRAALRAQADAVRQGGGLSRAYRAAVDGRTGIDCFDAWVGELLDTGYLHNHARMWFASIWIFTLRLPWELGADFTYRHFLDGDPASNTLSWRWVAGLHTRGKTYLARPANIAEYTNGRFAPEGLAVEAIALQEADVGPAGPLRPALAEAPPGRALLLVAEDDLHPESLPLGQAEVAGVVACHAARERSPFDVADHVVRFAEGALDDALVRSAERFGVAGEKLARLDPDDIARRCRALGVRRVVTAHAPVGPMAERIADLRARLGGGEVEILEIRREEDSAIWPFATKGFFGLRERIPELVTRLGIGDPDPTQPDLFAAGRGRASPHR